MIVPVEVHFKSTTLYHGKKPFPVVWREGFNWDSPQRFIAGYRPPTKPVSAKRGTCAPFAKKAGYKVVGVWKETASDLCQNPPPPSTNRNAGSIALGRRSSG